jgi:signal transduction histidine kinase
MERLGRIPLRQPVRGIALRAAGDTVGWLVVGRTPMAPPDRLLRPEELLMQRIVRAIAFGALGAVCLALILGIFLARTITRPIRELTTAAEAIGDGQLGAQVPVHSQDELGQLARSFNQMSADLARTTDARRQMTADVAHELRTPLSVLLGYSEALQDGKLEGDAQTYSAMYDTARQLQRLVDDLRTLALADAGELMLNRRPVEPRALLERCLLAQMAQAQGAQVQLRIEAAEDLPEVDADPDRIAQVFNNLAINALRHTPAGGSVTLSAAPSASGDGVVLEVADTGSGIALEDLPYVFDRFYRGDKARQSDNGESGLGLSIARSIIESHGGVIEVASERGSGTTFTITLPRA